MRFPRTPSRRPDPPTILARNLRVSLMRCDLLPRGLLGEGAHDQLLHFFLDPLFSFLPRGLAFFPHRILSAASPPSTFSSLSLGTGLPIV